MASPGVDAHWADFRAFYASVCAAAHAEGGQLPTDEQLVFWDAQTAHMLRETCEAKKAVQREFFPCFRLFLSLYKILALEEAQCLPKIVCTGEQLLGRVQNVRCFLEEDANSGENDIGNK